MDKKFKKPVTVDFDFDEIEKLNKIIDSQTELTSRPAIIKWLVSQFDIANNNIKQVSVTMEKINDKVETGEIDRSDLAKWMKDLNK